MASFHFPRKAVLWRDWYDFNLLVPAKQPIPGVFEKKAVGLSKLAVASRIDHKVHGILQKVDVFKHGSQLFYFILST